jgi:disulfide bond formation protein DsbB
MVTDTARNWPWGAIVASAALLAVAHAFQTFGHMAPCELCLKQRLIYWIAIAVAVAGVAARGGVKGRDLTLWLNALLTLVFLAEFGLAAYHAGVEWKFWPGPAACTGGAMRVDPAALERLLSGAKMGLPSCDKPAFVFLGLSMAGWNALAAAALTLLSGAAVVKSGPPS